MAWPSLVSGAIFRLRSTFESFDPGGRPLVFFRQRGCWPDRPRATMRLAVISSSLGPLEGVTVLDLSAYIAGPYACSLLADLGAAVIKIEPPGGDTLRHFPSTLEPESRAFLGMNRSKRGIVLDLKQP